MQIEIEELVETMRFTLDVYQEEMDMTKGKREYKEYNYFKGAVESHTEILRSLERILHENDDSIKPSCFTEDSFDDDDI
jgi:hypothetical protein